MNMIKNLSIVFCDTKSVGLNIGRTEEVGIRIYVRKAIKLPPSPPDRAISWILQICSMDSFKLLH